MPPLQVRQISGPFDQPPVPLLCSSGLGLVPKHDGGWRTICQLSAPNGSSINDHIDPGSFSLTYCSVDDAYAIVNSLGTGALMSKIDLKNAFRLISVCPHDWNLLGMQWRGKFYVDTFLPFGLRSASSLFNQLSMPSTGSYITIIPFITCCITLMISSPLVHPPLKNAQTAFLPCFHCAKK